MVGTPGPNGSLGCEFRGADAAIFGLFLQMSQKDEVQRDSVALSSLSQADVGTVLPSKLNDVFSRDSTIKHWELTGDQLRDSP
jgi:hypothetical protein